MVAPVALTPAVSKETPKPKAGSWERGRGAKAPNDRTSVVAVIKSETAKSKFQSGVKF